jgi:hypothetical protein
LLATTSERSEESIRRELSAKRSTSINDERGAMAKQVKPFGEWDYAHTVGQQYAAFGNFNYGATCAAQGLSLIGCQQGAGLAAYGTASKNVLGGGPWIAGPGNVINPATAKLRMGLPDYGDQSIPSENPSVINGYNAQIWHQVCHQ